MASKNDITGDTLISMVNTDKFRDNFDLIFRKGKSDEQRISEGILELTSTPSVDEIYRTHESCDAVVESLTCSQCGCITDDLYYSFCERCFTK